MVKIWDTEEWRLLHALENEGAARYSSGSGIDIVALSPDGRRIVVAQPSSLRVWDAESGQLLVHWRPVPENDDFSPHYGGITDIAFSPEGRYLASGGLDKTVKIWDVEAEVQVLDRDFLNYVETVAWSPDGSRMAAGSADGRIIVWDHAAGTGNGPFRGTPQRSRVGAGLRARREPHRHRRHRRLGQGLERGNGRATLRIAGRQGSGFPSGGRPGAPSSRCRIHPAADAF